MMIFRIFIISYLNCKKHIKIRQIWFYSLDKNGQIYGHEMNLNMVDIECIFEHRVN